MKITHILAAATLIAGVGASTAATAQSYRHDGYGHRQDRNDYRDYRHHDRDRDGRYGRDHRGGGHRGWNHGRRCHTEYRHRRPVTVCYR